MTLALSILLALGSSTLTKNMYPRLEGMVRDKDFTGAHSEWHTKRNTVCKSSQISADKTFTSVYMCLSGCLYDAFISVLTRHHVALVCLATTWLHHGCV